MSNIIRVFQRFYSFSNATNVFGLHPKMHMSCLVASGTFGAVTFTQTVFTFTDAPRSKAPDFVIGCLCGTIFGIIGCVVGYPYPITGPIVLMCIHHNKNR